MVNFLQQEEADLLISKKKKYNKTYEKNVSIKRNKKKNR